MQKNDRRRTDSTNMTLNDLALSWDPEREERTLYRITGWEEFFENCESRKVRKLTFVCVPNKHDGKGFGKVRKLPQPFEVLGAWKLIVEIASKQPIRGVLADEQGPMSAQDLADMTAMDVLPFERALQELSAREIGWITAERFKRDNNPDTSGKAPDASGRFRRNAESEKNTDLETPSNRVNRENLPTRPDASGDYPDASGYIGTKGEGREGNGREEPPTAPQGGQGLRAPEALKRICAIFGRDPNRRLGYEAEHDLAMICPIPEHEMAVVEWFYRLQPSEGEFNPRHRSVEKLIKNFLKAVDEARAHAKNSGVSGPGSEKNKKRAAEPDGWREWINRQGFECPAEFNSLPPDLQREAWEAAKKTEAAA